ncbi:hypothetical protein AAG570_001008 [Ranatra chinensis]|uniref:dipeptidase E n=1 Tax=Ranatra chinensis TaxID=642074 RepID=A0ABD0YYS4_9HEMI
MRNLLLLSNSTMHGTEYLQYAAENVKSFLKKFSVEKVLFIPYALTDYDKYEHKVKQAFSKFGFDLKSIHRYESPIDAISEAQAIYCGGGNTFCLLKALYDFKILKPIRDRVLLDGVPYIGASAGSNVATKSINTTNDMPIVYPPSFVALELLPFNINPHYIDADVNSKHMGETREERIKQYHEVPNTPPVLCLREGSMIQVEGDNILLKGLKSARVFIRDEEPKEYDVGTDLSFLLKH